MKGEKVVKLTRKEKRIFKLTVISGILMLFSFEFIQDNILDNKINSYILGTLTFLISLGLIIFSVYKIKSTFSTPEKIKEAYKSLLLGFGTIFIIISFETVQNKFLNNQSSNYVLGGLLFLFGLVIAMLAGRKKKK